jgi:hypothetical protein
MGAGDGLRLMLRTAEIEQAQLMYERVMLAITPLPRTSIRGESWRTVTVRYTPQGASVSLDETPLFTHVPLPHFAPTHRWRIAIGARCGRLDDLQRLDAVTFTRGASLELAFTAVRLSANGRDFSPSTTLFEYYAPPTVLSVEPPCGPLDGGTSVTIRGLGLQRPAESLSNGRSSGYKCGWGACDCALRTDCVRQRDGRALGRRARRTRVHLTTMARRRASSGEWRRASSGGVLGCLAAARDRHDAA